MDALNRSLYCPQICRSCRPCTSSCYGKVGRVKMSVSSFARRVIVTVLTATAAACFAQESTTATPADNRRETKFTVQKIRDLPAEWLIGPYVPSNGPLQPLSNQQRREVYVKQTFLSAQAYVARAFVAGIDQARGTPSEWEGGMSGYGKRFGSRYGSFVIASTIESAGNAALGYENRYD